MNKNVNGCSERICKVCQANDNDKHYLDRRDNIHDNFEDDDINDNA